jgi:3-hydroxyacyl-CoA dehydrogenase
MEVARTTRPPFIGSIAVLGAGTMGAQIAAHFANAGIPARLLDLDEATARAGLDRARKLRPDPFFTAERAALVTTGGLDTDLNRIADADWVIEAIVEQLGAKQELLARVDAARRPGTIVSSNTSGIPIHLLGENRSEDFRRHWLGTHFFNPPRYLRLLEVIPTPETDPAVVDAVRRFADLRLGKGVVIARDTPNFIANHVALYGVLRMIEAVESGRYTVAEVDAITGPAIGRPKSATFRTMDIAGLDVLAHVLRNLHDRLPAESRDAFKAPALLERMIEKGLFGEKAGAGFYKRIKGPDGESTILAIDPATLEYHPSRAALSSLDAAKAIEDVKQRTRSLFESKDRVGEFLRTTLAPMLVYTARIAPDVAHSIDDVDWALKWGFGWELGPFETIDAIGAKRVAGAWTDAAQSEVALPPLFESSLKSGRDRVRASQLTPPSAELMLLQTRKSRSAPVKTNPGASVVDLDDGVLAVEFHSKMNTIGGDTLQMLGAGVAEAERNGVALVVGNDAVNFSAGANLMLLLLEAQEGNWDDVDLMVRSFQACTSALRYAHIPVVVAPAGLTLGGGCEIALHGARVQAAAETYIGLVEVGVGLIPAAGGTKEMLARAVEELPARADLLPAAQRVFETIGLAKVSTSALDAKALRYLRDVDGISMNRDRVIWDAKQHALDLVRDGYQPPARRSAIRVGGDSLRAALELGIHLAHRSGRISEYDVVVGRALAGVLSGGAVPHETTVSEQYLLDLEREAFLGLCGERKTLERIQHTLKTGKALRN